MIVKKKLIKTKISYRPRVRVRCNSDSKTNNKKAKLIKKIKNSNVRKSLRAKLSTRAKVSSCNLVRSCKFYTYPYFTPTVQSIKLATHLSGNRRCLVKLIPSSIVDWAMLNCPLSCSTLIAYWVHVIHVSQSCSWFNKSNWWLLAYSKFFFSI